MEYFWAIVIVIILAFFGFAIVSDRFESHKRKKIRETALPESHLLFDTTKEYDVYLSDGKQFKDVKIIGLIDGENNPFGDWHGFLVLRLSNSKKAYTRYTCIRCMIEK